MGRYDQVDLTGTGIQLSEPVYESYFYDINGKKLKCKYTDTIAEKRHMCAKHIINTLQDKHTYFVRTTLSGHLYDPFASIQTIVYSRGHENWKLVEVSESIFNSYVKYLITKNKIHFVTSQRRVFDEKR
jgi:hypothetical protein